MYHGVACRKLRARKFACLFDPAMLATRRSSSCRARADFSSSGGCSTALHGFVKLLKFATLVATVVFVARKDIFLFPKVVEVEQLFCLFFSNAAVKIQKILSSLYVEQQSAARVCRKIRIRKPIFAQFVPHGKMRMRIVDKIALFLLVKDIIVPVRDHFTADKPKDSCFDYHLIPLCVRILFLSDRPRR